MGQSVVRMVIRSVHSLVGWLQGRPVGCLSASLSVYRLGICCWFIYSFDHLFVPNAYTTTYNNDKQ